jgi:hypothetical protein
MFVVSVVCLSGRGLCDGLITRPEESYRLWRVVVWSRNLENEEAKARYWLWKNTTTVGCNARKTNMFPSVCKGNIRQWEYIKDDNLSR